MKVTVTKDNVKITEYDMIHEGEHKVNKCFFSFSEEYTDDKVKKAIFTLQNESVEVPIINNECDIPTKILKAKNIVLLGVYAYKIIEDKLILRYSPSPDAFNVNLGSYIERVKEAEEITASQFEQYMQALQNGLNAVQSSINELNQATANANNLVDDINTKLENGDFNGQDGKDGVGITTIISGQETQQNGKTITPMIVNKTDGTQQTLDVSAKNGTNGINGVDGVTPNLQVGIVTTLEPNEQASVTRTGTDEEPLFNFGIPKGQQGEHGQNGITPSVGENGNWYLGDVDTGKPSRGEVGPTPDLTDYVKNTDYSSYTKAGVIKTNAYSVEVDINGFLRGQTLTKEQFHAGGNSDFMSKGTLINIRDYYVDSSTPIKKLNTSLRNITPKQDTKGTNNTFEDGLDMNLFELSGDGESQQVTTTGKQLFDNNNITRNKYLMVGGEEDTHEVWGISDYIPIKSNTNYTLSNLYGNNVTACFYDDNKNYISDIGGYANSSIKNFTTPDNAKYFRFSVIIQETNIKYNLDKVQLEEGSEATNYEPYTGGQPSPSPDYPQPINSIENSLEFNCSGKNLLDLTKGKSSVSYHNITNISSNKLTATSTGDYSYYSLELDVPKNRELFFSFKGKTSLVGNDIRNWFGISYIDDVNIIDIAKFTMTTTENKYKHSFLSTSNKIYLIFYLNLTSTKEVTLTIDDLMISYDDSEYEPYVEPNQVTFNLGEEKLRSVGDVKDELVVDLDTGDYYKQENIGEIVFDGSEDEGWEKYASVRDTKLFDYSFNIMSNIENIEFINFNYVQNGMCNMSKMGLYNARTMHECEKEGIEFGGTRFYFAYEKFSNYTLEEFKEWLNSHNIIANYILATPTTKKLGTLSSEDLTKLKTFYGYNNVTINTNLGLMNIRFNYGLDIKKYVDNKIAELSAQLIQGA